MAANGICRIHGSPAKQLVRHPHGTQVPPSGGAPAAASSLSSGLPEPGSNAHLNGDGCLPVGTDGPTNSKSGKCKVKHWRWQLASCFWAALHQELPGVHVYMCVQLSEGGRCFKASLCHLSGLQANTTSDGKRMLYHLWIAVSREYG